jgi:putative transposase
MSQSTSLSRVRATYRFIKAQSTTFPVQLLCHARKVAPSGYYAWLKQPLSNRAQDDARLLRLIRASFAASQALPPDVKSEFRALRSDGTGLRRAPVARAPAHHGPRQAQLDQLDLALHAPL